MTILEEVFSLAGKVAIVTGAASGFGRVFANAMAAAGADLALLDINELGLEETADQVHALGRKVHIGICDVSDEGAVKDAFDSIEKAMGNLDILVNNAGIGGGFRGLIHEHPTNEWQRMIDVNLNSVFYCSREALARMHAQKSGKIINLASIWGLVGGAFVNVAAYSASKGGVINLTREMALQYAQHGVQINAICPGFHVTSIMDFDDPDAAPFIQQLKDHTPAGRLASAEELKGTLIYLASSASNFMSGSIIAVDGGYLAQ